MTADSNPLSSEIQTNKCGWCGRPIPQPFQTCRDYWDDPCDIERNHFNQQFYQFQLDHELAQAKELPK